MQHKANDIQSTINIIPGNKIRPAIRKMKAMMSYVLKYPSQSLGFSRAFRRGVEADIVGTANLSVTTAGADALCS